jgi:hypothetical protein
VPGTKDQARKIQTVRRSGVLFYKLYKHFASRWQFRYFWHLSLQCGELFIFPAEDRLRVFADMKRLAGIAILASLISCLSTYAGAADLPIATPSLDRGFHLLYNLDFAAAQQVFASWQQTHTDDPLGPACEAAGLLFAEFNRLGVLEAEFYKDDRSFEARKKFTPDSALRTRFDAALNRAESRAQARLSQNASDRDALFALALSSGLRADYAALIEKHNLASLHYTKQATGWAQRLLAVDPLCYDAHLATGVSQYIIGSMAAPVRWLVRLGGVSGDKRAGIRELEITAEHGRYLAPFARILLAIAYVRDRDTAHARELLISLRQDFPENPLFAREIGKLDAQR